MKVDDIVDISIDRLGINGEGVGSLNGFTLFVDGALPQERVRAQLYEKRKSFGRAKTLQIITPSPHRVAPPCPLFGKCGGCQLMHLAYPEQLNLKRQRIVDALERIGKLFGIPVEPCKPSPSPLAYRNKIQLPFQDGSFGLYAFNSHTLVPVEHCLIHCTLGEKVFHQVQALHRQNPLPPSLKHLLIKTAVHTEQVLVILITSDASSFLSFAEKLRALCPEVKGVVQNIHNTSSNTILGEIFQTLTGQGWIEETIHNLTFKVSPASFFQVNPAQAEALYKQVESYADLTGKEHVLDAYCGVGTLSLLLASQAHTMLGVECVPAAIRDAEANAARNHITNATFTCAEAETFISTLSHLDVALLNPPRKGCAPLFLEKLVLLKPSKIVYVSCDPATLARDLAYLCSHGYSITGVQPFDMFPQTAHVECVVRLDRKDKRQL